MHLRELKADGANAALETAVDFLKRADVHLKISCVVDQVAPIATLTWRSVAAARATGTRRAAAPAEDRFRRIICSSAEGAIEILQIILRNRLTGSRARRCNDPHLTQGCDRRS